MNETEPLIEVSTHEVRTTDQTIWYSSEDKENKDEVLRRLIVWDDSFDFWENESTGSDESYEGGILKFYIHQKELYDRIFEYFNLHSNLCSFIAWHSTHFMQFSANFSLVFEGVVITESFASEGKGGNPSF